MRGPLYESHAIVLLQAGSMPQMNVFLSIFHIPLLWTPSCSLETCSIEINKGRLNDNM
jgi:hypothetical protein